MNNDTISLKRIFRGAIRRGTGRAHLMMQEYPDVNFSLDLLKAAVTNYAYNPQCEGSRGRYIVELIDLSAQKEKLIQQVLQKLLAETEDTWGLNQLFDIARILAQAGRVEARNILYQRFALGVLPEYAYGGGYSILRLDGMAGLQRVAEARGQLLTDDPDEWEDDRLIEYTQEENPEISVEAELAKTAETNEYVARYLAVVRATRQRDSQKPPRPARDFQSVLSLIAQKENTRLPGWLGWFVKELTRPQIRQLADALLLETNRHRQGKYLQVFRYVKFPHGYEKLLTLAETQPHRADRLVEDAVTALGFFKAPAIREFALHALATSETPWMYTDLLVNHYRRGDHRLLLHLAQQATSEVAIEGLACSYIKIYERHRTKQCFEPLNRVYHRMNCGIHRADVVAIMQKNGVLPNKIKAEIAFDSYSSVRELAAEV